MNTWVKIVLIISIFSSCSMSEVQKSIFNDGEAKVLVFISPDCPLCKSYTKDLKEMIDLYGDDIEIYGVLAGTFYTKYEVDSFLNYYDLPLEIIYDPNFKLVRDLNATITPEAFLIDENKNIKYQGLIDNWLGELGRRRQVRTEFYLNDAIESYLKDEDIMIKKTKAIGCFIE